MKKTIFKNIVTITAVSIIITGFLSGFFITNQLTKNTKQTVQKEAHTLANILNHDINYLNQELVIDTRITLIEKNGTVIYDTLKTSSENHLDRPEIVSAINNGQGESMRYSDTLKEKMYYYAIQLDNDSILRLAMQTSSLVKIMPIIIIYTSIIIICVIIIAAFIAKKAASNIVQPINNINLNNPSTDNIYPELQPLIANLQLHNKLRKEFSANVSHELKTPLTSISGYAEIMTNGIAKPEDNKIFASKIYQASQNLIQKINDIIKISKLDENQISLEIETINYHDLITNCLEKLDKFILDKSIHIVYTPKNIYGDCIKYVMEDILYNLIQNAIKYNKQNGTVFIYLSQINDNIIIKIKDTGIGIDDSDIERIYERFYRADTSHSSNIEGSGLGLAIVKHGINLHQGTIKCKSKINQETTFTITLPTHLKS